MRHVEVERANACSRVQCGLAVCAGDQRERAWIELQITAEQCPQQTARGTPQAPLPLADNLRSAYALVLAQRIGKLLIAVTKVSAPDVYRAGLQARLLRPGRPAPTRGFGAWRRWQRALAHAPANIGHAI